MNCKGTNQVLPLLSSNIGSVDAADCAVRTDFLKLESVVVVLDILVVAVDAVWMYLLVTLAPW